MKNLSSKQSKFISQCMILLLLIINTGIIFYPSYIIYLSIINVSIILISFYMMRSNINNHIDKEKIAESILKISNLILSVNSREDLYESILHEIIDTIPRANKGSLITVDEHGDLTFEAVVGFEMSAVRSLKIRFEDTFLFKAIKKEIPKSILIDDIGLKNKMILEDSDLDKMAAAGINDIRSTVSVPITFDKKIFGLINIDSTSEDTFTHQEIALIETFSSEISKVIRLYQLFEKTVAKSKYDGLTGIYNRRTFKTEMIESFKDITNNPFSLIYFDLDQLKEINDTYGHDTGDLYLKHFVTGIKTHLYRKEYFSRFGGDEFVLLYLREASSFQSFKNQCDLWFNENPFTYNQEVLEIRYSIGKADYDKDGSSLEELINFADHQMYQDKEQKRINKTR